MKADLDSLEEVVQKTVRKSALAHDFETAEIQAAEFDEKNEFIRVVLYFKNFERLSEENADEITSKLESVISQHDDRFPSIRFSIR